MAHLKAFQSLKSHLILGERFAFALLARLIGRPKLLKKHSKMTMIHDILRAPIGAAEKWKKSISDVRRCRFPGRLFMLGLGE